MGKVRSGEERVFWSFFCLRMKHPSTGGVDAQPRLFFFFFFSYFLATGTSGSSHGQMYQKRLELDNLEA